MVNFMLVSATLLFNMEETQAVTRGYFSQRLLAQTDSKSLSEDGQAATNATTAPLPDQSSFFARACMKGLIENVPSEFCWRTPQDGDKIPKCPTGYTRTGATCTRPCPAGTTYYLGDCWSQCPVDYSDAGAVCLEKNKPSITIVK